MSTSDRHETATPLVRMLGPVDVIDATGRVWVPKTPIRRSLLALLALDAGRVVEGERLLDMAWNGNSPSSGLSALRFHVSKLRQEVPAGLIETAPAGYQLRAMTDVRLVEQGVDVGEALARWRGEPMTGVNPCDVLDRERDRLGELRLHMAEQSFSEQIANGEAATVIAELRRLCREHPLRESLWTHLITAEYRAGNQADALRSFATLRANLVDELGIDPSLELQRLEERMLRQDPDLGSSYGLDRSVGAGDPTPAGSARGEVVAGVVAGRGNLSAPPSSFIGRQQELHDLEGLIGQVRLLALVGVGGVGKTRLGLELATRVKDRFDGGVWVVELWQIDDPNHVEDAIIGTLGLTSGQHRARRDVLVDALGFSPVLIVLDTCEHVVDAVSDLAEFLIGRCPQLTLVATSREVLSSPSAVSRSVASLGDAVDLFVARAQTTRGGFDLTEANRESVERICEQLDGIPLAIELVAARSATLDPRTIEARVGNVLKMVRSSGSGRPKRHRTLEATIAWSYDLLEPGEQLVFHRLSVFLGGFTLSAAEHVCSDDGGVDRDDVVDLLERLVDKSMVTTTDDRWIGRRFRLLDTTRAFGRDRLVEAGDSVASSRRHAGFYSEWVGEVSRTAWGPDAGRVRREIVAEIPNLRLATEWFISTNDIGGALTLASMGKLLAQAGRFDGAQWLAPVLELAGADEHPAFVTAVGSVARQLFEAGDLDAAERVVERGLALGEDPLLLGALGMFNRVRAYATNPPDQALLDSCLSNSRRAVELADTPIRKLTVYGPFLFYLSEGNDLDEFYRYWDEYVELWSNLESESSRAWAAVAAGALAEVDPEAARPMVEEALGKSGDLGMPFVTSRSRGFLAGIDASSGRPEQAARHLFEAIEEAAATGSWFVAWGWMHRLVLVLASAGNLEAAVVLHHAIPPGRALVWAGDAPEELLDRAEEQFGTRRYRELARDGSRMQRADLITWIRDVVHALESAHASGLPHGPDQGVG